MRVPKGLETSWLLKVARMTNFMTGPEIIAPLGLSLFGVFDFKFGFLSILMLCSGCEAPLGPPVAS